VFATGARQRLWEVLDICLRDRREAWVLKPDGHYEQLQPEEGATGPEGLGTHGTLMDLTRFRVTV
jgi:polyphosphate kinase